MTRFALLALALPLFAACSDDGHTDVVSCATETRDDDFFIGFSKPGASGRLDFSLMDMTPSPPSRGDNTWVIQINQAAGGAPVTGATLNVTPFMPDHGHNSPLEVLINAMPTAGQYKLEPVNLWMPGLWETTIEATTASGNDTVVFKVCVPS